MSANAIWFTASFTSPPPASSRCCGVKWVFGGWMGQWVGGSMHWQQASGAALEAAAAWQR